MLRRNTPQKIEILNHLKSVCNHPTADQVYHVVKEKIPKITLATTYRNLNILAHERKILKLEINNEFHFDADLDKHQHFVCEDCKKIYDVFEEKVSNYALNNIKGFRPNQVQIIYHGVCDECGEDKNE
ncbi:transcriptional repressor [Candidatus Woesearchaeota archaeon]|nr:transcriptional repressor [Candidatus Woesearchaeota archaeon]